MKRRLIACLLCLCMLISLVPVFSISAGAVTFSRVVSWMDSVKGKAMDFDGKYGAQCLDLFCFYLRDVWGISSPFASYPVSYAYQVFDYNAPSGWTKISGVGNYRAGDVVIWNKTSTNSTGHVGIVYSVSGGSVVICQQNFNKMQYVTMQPLHNPSAIRGVFRPPITVEPFRFDDVRDEAAFYFDPVYWAYNHKPQITTGTSDTLFSPNKNCTRAEIVTFLWRTAGEPAPKDLSNPFTDVPDGQYFTKAVLWAVEQGITKGTGENNFSPMRICSRSEIVTFLWRANDEPEAKDSNNLFSDVLTGEFYTEAVLWAVENGITNGISTGGGIAFSPKKNCSRAEIVTFLYRCFG